MMKTTRDFRFARLARAGTRSNNPGGRAFDRRRGDLIGRSLLRRMSPEMAVRPEGANHQWRKIPPRELSIDLVADERLGRGNRRAGASWTKWLSAAYACGGPRR